MINNEQTVSVMMERPIDSSVRQEKETEGREGKGSGACVLCKEKLTAVERRDSDRKRNTPMIIGSCRKFGFFLQLMRPSHSETSRPLVKKKLEGLMLANNVNCPGRRFDADGREAATLRCLFGSVLPLNFNNARTHKHSRIHTHIHTHTQRRSG